MDKIKKILDVQYYLIVQLLIDVEFQIKHQEMMQLGQLVPQTNKRYLNHIAMLTSNNIITNLAKLIYQKEHHSFQKVVNLIEHNQAFKNKNDFIFFKEELKFIQQQGDKLKIKDIRDTYVAHLDITREFQPYNFVAIRDLIYHIQSSFEMLFQSVTGESILLDVDKNILTELLDDFNYIIQSNQG
ncbi:MAG: hypothetical protein O9297_07265 [Flavobacterium sp.]|uniref:hypothetical protein n=1 Tax=Flavobacterium sp. TaxID=239 RepID=UPI0022BC4E02|nr:hypothetical protein [Flavobacterium sp.]MCZ8297002.1 hypothetical protein [Flavobacterium sp.]